MVIVIAWPATTLLKPTSPNATLKKPQGAAATRRARQRALEAGTVDFVILPGRDKYGRGLARVFLHGQDLGSILITEGLARPYAGGRRKSWLTYS